jgi:asparagine synthase (glutamine-hydrolysing)
MCGVTGAWARGGPIAAVEAAVRRANDSIAHRGPDGHGTFSDAESGVVLAHRRLSIVDLSPAGAQPMTSASGRYVISFNGEVYNHVALRKELVEKRAVGTSFRGHSDTETMLGWIEADGVRAAVDRFVGMFAFALWDRRERTLTLVRDRVGIKPMYWAVVGSTLAFGSELSTIRAHPGAARELDPAGVQEYLRRGCVPAPRSILRGVHKLEPGTIATFHAPEAPPEIERYWSFPDVARAGLSDPLGGSIDEQADAVEAVLSDAVALRMEADVPVGAFLSGGIDSSTVVALMQKQSSRRVKTFSIGNETAAYDESVAAEAVAKHLGTEHTALVVRGSDAATLLPKLVDRMDEPFADSSILPTFLVSQLARAQVTVSLSGDGGDELFAGYNRHLWIARVERALRMLPKRPVRLAARGVLRVPEARAETLLAPLRSFVRRPGAQARKLARAVSDTEPGALYDLLASVFVDPPVPSCADRSWRAPPLGDPTLDAMLRDAVGYLPDDILTKVDRASMMVSLEARVPILDHRVVALAWRIPLASKVQNGRGKEVLRRVLYRHVPPALVDRPKSGFGVPIGDWMRGPLREWTEARLEPGMLARIDGLDTAAVRRMLAAHLAGTNDESSRLFAVAVLTDWVSRLA